MSVKSFTCLLAMVRVTDVEDEEAPTVLIVDNNKMSLHRLTNIFRQREFNVLLAKMVIRPLMNTYLNLN